MIDCPATLHSGADLIISLSVHICTSAFIRASSTPDSTKQAAKNVFNEGQETQDEQILRERKSSLLKLFDAIGLRPRAGADFSKYQDKSDSELHAGTVKKLTQAHTTKQAIKTEIVGDGEEIEVEESEDLSENELDMIYKRSALQISHPEPRTHSFQGPGK